MRTNGRNNDEQQPCGDDVFKGEGRQKCVVSKFDGLENALQETDTSKNEVVWSTYLQLQETQGW